MSTSSSPGNQSGEGGGSVCLICLARFNQVNEEGPSNPPLLSPQFNTFCPRITSVTGAGIPEPIHIMPKLHIFGDVEDEGDDDITENNNQPKRLPLSKDNFTRFLVFASRHLNLGDRANEVISNAKLLEKKTGEPIEAFCENCGSHVENLCDQYEQLQVVKLKLQWRLGEIKEALAKSMKITPPQLVHELNQSVKGQINAKSTTSVKNFRQLLNEKCKLMTKKKGWPLVKIHPGLIPEESKFSYPDTKENLMRLITVFTLASSSFSSKICKPSTTTGSVLLDALKAPYKNRSGLGNKQQSAGNHFLDGISDSISSSGKPISYLEQLLSRGKASIEPEPLVKVKEEIEDPVSEMQPTITNVFTLGTTATVPQPAAVTLPSIPAPPEELDETEIEDYEETEWDNLAPSEDPLCTDFGASSWSDPLYNIDRVSLEPQLQLPESSNSNSNDSRTWSSDWNQEGVYSSTTFPTTSGSASLNIPPINSPYTEPTMEKEVASGLPCQHCNKAFHTGSALHSHITKAHYSSNCPPLLPPSSSLKSRRLSSSVSSVNPNRGKRGLKVCDKENCLQEFLTVEELNEHLKLHLKIQLHFDSSGQLQTKEEEGSTIFMCSVCKQGFFRRHNLTLHQLSHNAKNRQGKGFECPICKCHYMKSERLKIHYNMVHGAQAYFHKCPICLRTSAGELGVFRAHVRSHESEKNPMETETSPSMNSTPTSKNTNTMVVVINSGTAATPTLEAPRTPIPEPSPRRPSLECSISSDSNLGSDTKTQTGNENQEVSAPTPVLSISEEAKAELKCSYCDWKCVKQYNLSLHELEHTGKNSTGTGYNCPVCGNEYGNTARLRMHYMLLHGEKRVSGGGGSVSYQVAKAIFSSYDTQKNKSRDSSSASTSSKSSTTATTYKNQNQAGGNDPDPEWGAKSRKEVSSNCSKHQGIKKLFQCPICKQRFMMAHKLRLHIKTMHEMKPQFKCETCHKRFTHKMHLVLHLKRGHDLKKDRKRMATVTGLELTASSSLKGLTQSDQEKVQKEKEGRSSDPEIERKSKAKARSTFFKRMQDQFQKTKSQKKRFHPCPQCHRVFVDGQSLTSHLNMVHHQRALRQYKCPDLDCSLTFRRQLELFLHRREVHGLIMKKKLGKSLSEIVCDDKGCVERFQSVQDLNDHLKLHLLESEKKGKSENCEEVSTPRSIHTCPTCSRGYLNKYNLDLHQLHHIPNKCGGFSCPTCGHHLNSRSRLISHFHSIHGENRTPLECKKCGKSFHSSLSYFKKHLRLHEEKRLKQEPQEGKLKSFSFTCNLCEKRFIHSANFQAHLKTHNQEPPANQEENGGFNCTICNYISPNERDLWRHMTTNHGKKPADWYHYQCNDCLRMYRHKKNLVAHLRLVHNKVPVSKTLKSIDPSIPDCGKTSQSKRLGSDRFHCTQCKAHFRFRASLSAHQKSCVPPPANVPKKEILVLSEKGWPIGITDIEQTGVELTKEQKHGLRRCPKCFKKFTFKMFLYHVRYRHKEDLELFFRCATCQEKFSTQSELKTHKRETHTDGIRGKRGSLLLRSKRGNYLKFCDKEDCLEGFRTVEELNQHLLTHLSDDVFIEGDGEEHFTTIYNCSVCHWGFLRKYYLSLHELTHKARCADGKGFDCPACNKHFTGREPFVLHYNMIHGERRKPYKCPVCQRSFSSIGSYFKEHVNSCRIDAAQDEAAHAEAAVVAEAKADEGKSKKGTWVHTYNRNKPGASYCSVCGKEFLRRHNWRSHMRQEHGLQFPEKGYPDLSSSSTEVVPVVGPVELPSLNLTSESGIHWVDNGMAKRVLRKEHGNVEQTEKERPKNSVLQIESSNSSSKSRKRKSDMKERTYENRDFNISNVSNGPSRQVQCPVCGKLFDSRGISKHMALRHATHIKFPCTLCGIKFNKLRDLQTHLRRAHQNVVNCILCGKQYESQKGLDYHYKNVHNIENVNQKTPSSSQALKAHWNQFETEGPFEVKVEEVSTPNSVSVEQSQDAHVLNQNQVLDTTQSQKQQDSLACPHCPMKFPTEVVKDLHVKLAHVTVRALLDNIDLGLE